MAKSLFINRVTLNPPKGKSDVTFKPGLNVIRAVLADTISIEDEERQPGTRNSVGKTTFVNLLDYGLGKTNFLPRDKVSGRKMLQSHDLLMEFSVGEKHYTVQRNLVKGENCLLYEGWVIQQCLEGNTLSVELLSIADYRNLLERLLFEGENIYERDKFVSYRDVMQIIFREQVGGFEMIDKPGNYNAIAESKRKLLQFLSGLVTSETLGVDKRVNEAEELEKDAKKALDIIKKYVNHKVNQAEELILAEANSVAELISIKKEKINELKQVLIYLQERSDQRLQKKQELLHTRTKLSKEEQLIHLRINSFQATLNEIETERNNIKTANQAQLLFDGFAYEKCPVCMVPITDDPSFCDAPQSQDTIFRKISYVLLPVFRMRFSRFCERRIEWAARRGATGAGAPHCKIGHNELSLAEAHEGH